VPQFGTKITGGPARTAATCGNESGAEGAVLPRVELKRLEPLTPCMPSQLSIQTLR
jgi:hypothetical protein